MHIASGHVLQETVREAGNIGGREVPVCVMSVRILVLLLPFYRTHARKSHTPVVFLSFVVMLPARRARPPDSHLFIRQHVPSLHISCCRP